MKEFTFIDLFAGVGWFHIALSNLWGKCVWYSEFDDKCCKTYETNFWNIPAFWDITKIKWPELPDFDILCWWFPCQPFSIAGYRKWFEDERGNLFFDTARVIKAKKPKVVFLENVKNLASHDWWHTLKVIIEALENLWYHVKYSVLNSNKIWWVPQNRERIYIVWFLDKEACERFSFPTEKKRISISNILEKWKVDDKYYYNWKPLYDKIKDWMTKKETFYQRRRIYIRENKNWVCPTLTANMWTWWHNVPIILDDYWIRKLTPRECFRLQWFPEEYKLPNIADCYLYKQAGNAVTVWSVQSIMENILASL